MKEEDTKTIAGQYKDTGLDLLDRGFGEIRNLDGGGVKVIWNDLPEEARKAGWFKLVSKKETLILNKHQLHYLLRNV